MSDEPVVIDWEARYYRLEQAALLSRERLSVFDGIPLTASQRRALFTVFDPLNAVMAAPDGRCPTCQRATDAGKPTICPECPFNFSPDECDWLASAAERASEDSIVPGEPEQLRALARKLRSA